MPRTWLYHDDVFVHPGLPQEALADGGYGMGTQQTEVPTPHPLELLERRHAVAEGSHVCVQSGGGVKPLPQVTEKAQPGKNIDIIDKE